MNVKDFEAMKFNPLMKSGSAYIWNVYPDFKRRKDLCTIPVMEDDPSFMWVPESEDLDKLLRFVILFSTNKGNPLARELSWDRRKEMCYDVIGMGKNHRVRKDVIEPGHRWYQQVLGVYFRMIGDDMMESWVALKTQHANFMSVLRANPLETENLEKNMAMRVVIQKALPDLLENIRTFEGKLFPAPEIKEAVWDNVTAEFDGPGGFAEYYAMEWKS